MQNFFDYNQLKNQIDEFIKKFSSKINPNTPDDTDKEKGELHGKNPSKGNSNGHGKGKKKRKGYVSPELQGEEDEKKLKQGDKAEEKVYEEIKAGKIKEINNYFSNSENLQVQWCSAAAKRKKKWFAVDALGYDIEIKDLDTGKQLFIEVKSSSQCILNFEMSENEYFFAKDNPTKYMVIFVANIELDKDISSNDIHPLPMDFLSSEDYCIEPTKYQIYLLSDSE